MKEIIVKMESNGQLFPVRELIRCKDCEKHESMYCTLWTDAVEFETEDNWFCADAEPKGGDSQ